jgi:hypothetical protein
MATVRVVTAKNGSEAAGAWLNDRAAKLVLVQLYTYYLSTVVVLPLALQVIEPVLGGLENISRRFINNLVWDLILVCIDAPGDWL